MPLSTVCERHVSHLLNVGPEWKNWMRLTLPTTLPHPRDAVLGQTLSFSFAQYAYRSANVTPGSTTAKANFSLTSRILFMRCRSMTIEPFTRGAGPPYLVHKSISGIFFSLPGTCDVRHKHCDIFMIQNPAAQNLPKILAARNGPDGDLVCIDNFQSRLELFY